MSWGVGVYVDWCIIQANKRNMKMFQIKHFFYNLIASKTQRRKKITQNKLEEKNYME